MRLDHLAVTCADLETGRCWVEAALGCRLQPGGTHPLMGTHNLLLGLESGTYLEVIAPDPAAPPPGHARWFGLDTPPAAPRLGAWIASVPRISAAPEGSGRVLELSRGDLRWSMAVPDTGVSLDEGMAPYVIAWQGAAHPSRSLTPSGIALERLEVRARGAGALAARLGMKDPRVSFVEGAPSLVARFRDASGRPRVLG